MSSYTPLSHIGKAFCDEQYTKMARVYLCYRENGLEERFDDSFFIQVIGKEGENGDQILSHCILHCTNIEW